MKYSRRPFADLDWLTAQRKNLDTSCDLLNSRCFAPMTVHLKGLYASQRHGDFLSLQCSAVSELGICVLIKICWIVTGICASVKSEDRRLDCPSPSHRLSTWKTLTCLWDLVFPVVISLLSNAHEPDAQALVCRNCKSYAADWSLNRKPTKFTCQRKSHPRQYHSPSLQKCSKCNYILNNIMNTFSDSCNVSRITSFDAFITVFPMCRA